MQEMPAGAPAPEAANNEDAIVDQIGALLNQLSPEKQKVLVSQLGAMMSGGEGQELDQATDPHAGANGVPAERI